MQEKQGKSAYQGAIKIFNSLNIPGAVAPTSSRKYI